MTNASLFQTTRCLCLAARRASRKITREFDQALREHGMRATQFTLLSALSLSGPMAIGELADLLAADRTTITRNLALVEKRNLAVVHADPADARSRIASITPEGQALLLDALPVWRKVQAALTATMGEPTAAALRELAGGPCMMPLPGASPEASA